MSVWSTLFDWGKIEKGDSGGGPEARPTISMSIED